MTNRQFSENQTRTNRRALHRIISDAPQKNFRRRGVLPSFGDIILPVVGVAAIGLLAVAGRQFFINGLQSSPGIASTRAYADSPVLMAERERTRLRQTLENQTQNQASAPENLDFKFNNNPSVTNTVATLATPAQTNQNQNPNTNINITVEPVKPETKPAPKPAPKPTAKPAQKTPPAKPQTPAKTQTQTGSWRVQIGAFGTKQSAQDAAKKLSSKGYKTTVYSNPGSKYVKVWVSAGNSKQDANKIVDAMKKLGYGSSYAIPPAAK